MSFDREHLEEKAPESDETVKSTTKTKDSEGEDQPKEGTSEESKEEPKPQEGASALSIPQAWNVWSTINLAVGKVQEKVQEKVRKKTVNN